MAWMRRMSGKTLLRLGVKSALGATSALALYPWLPSPAAAEPCATDNQGNVTCTGDPDLPIVYDDIPGLTLTSLSTALAPPAGTAIATVTNAGGPVGNNEQGAVGVAGSIAYDSPSFGFTTVAAPGLTIVVVGGNGGNGAGSSDGVGASGGEGGGGEAATISVVAPSVAVSGTGVAAIQASSAGGTGGAGVVQPSGFSHLTGGTSGTGGASNGANVTADVGTLSIAGGATGIRAESLGGAGGTVGPNAYTLGSQDIDGSAGGEGGSAGPISATLSLPSVTVADGTGAGVVANSTGGAGGLGGMAVSEVPYSQEVAIGGAGGAGGAGGSVTVSGSLVLSGTTGNGFVGVLAQSTGGAGGTGGAVSGGEGSSGGAGGAGGAGGNVSVGTTTAPFRLDASLQGDGTRALAAVSYGGAGGEGGETQNDYGIKGKGGAAAGGGTAGGVSVYLAGSAATAGNSSDAIFLQSVGGFAGTGSAGAFGASDQSYGVGGDIVFSGILSSGADGFGLSTGGNASDALVLQSVGGGGGKALQELGLTSLGSTSLAGGDGGTVTATLGGVPIHTTGSFSRGIYADSVGGGGGNGGADTGVATLGAAGGAGGNGGDVQVTVSTAISTLGDGSDALFAASRGGGGGSANSATGAFTIGGQNGGGGGTGGAVSVGFSNGVSTAGSDADAVTAQSVGGGGGDGANAVAAGVLYVQAVGGKGGTGGDAGQVTIGQSGTVQGAVTTSGDRSRGVVAQSAGGGGGSGGSAVAATAFVVGYEHAVGGSGGTGGAGAAVQVGLIAPVATNGDHSDAVFAQSAGGGGGSASSTIDASVGAFAIQQGVGGAGGSGGSAAAVTVTTQSAISAIGNHSSGIVAEAIGGGGGHSGIVMNGSVAGATIGVAVGGGGGSGGDVTGKVSVAAAGAVTTQGHASAGILAHSIGDGGGHGSTVVSADVANMASVNVDLGGKGGNGGSADDVEVTAGGVSTKGHHSNAISAISAGGGGGSGGVVASASAVSAANLDVSIGGNGGAGGNAGKVTVQSSGAVQTTGAMSDGILASSLGGFGGDAGVGLLSDSTTNVASVGNVVLALGGDGGKGGSAGDVSVTAAGGVSTAGILSSGIYAQSLGGGGGRARGTLVANVGDVGNVSVSVGGDGGAGGNAGDVSISTASGETIATKGAFSHGAVAQSIGGAGGSGGFAGEFSINVSAPDSGVSGQVGVTVGGGGAAGGRAGTVTVDNASAIETADFGSFGIFAQTVGGHGGDGGNVYAGNLTISQNASVNVDVDVGGDGGFGTEGNTVKVTNSGAITTGSFFSTALAAQAVGGNGGNGGSTYAVLAQIGPGSPGNLQVSVGGAGGGGGKGGEVDVTNQAALVTKGGGSDAISAQSIGGGGGRGGSAGYIGLNLTPPVKFENDSLPFNINVNVGAGGGGGQGADGNTVTVKNTEAIATTGTRSRGIFAQSVGGGGGDGGTASATSFAVSDICNLGVSGDYVCPTSDDEGDDVSVELNSTVQIGGDGGAAGDGGAVSISNSGNITTQGQLSHGIYAQSIGGGGGNGGEGALGIEAWTTNQLAINITDLPGNFLPSFSSYDVAVGGKASGGGDGSTVDVTNSGAITILGPDPSYLTRYTGVSGGIANPLPFLAGGSGIFAQSVGGGGGDGGAGSSGLTATVTVGNGGGKGGDGGAVTVNNTGTITNSSGFSGTGIFAQSVGGGGGVAGDIGLGFSDPWEKLNIGAGIAISESPGDGGDGGEVNVTSQGAIRTTGTASSGIVAQSVGGSGGIAAIHSSNPKDTIYVGSGGAAGNGGDVTATVDADVTVTGSGSVGVVALSAGGTGSGDQSGTVTVNVNADILASGQGGRGILVSSDSYKNQNTGVVAINIAQGATVATGALGAETIGILAAGPQSSLTNAGTIVSANADSYAFRVTSKNVFSMENYGTITGSILGTSVQEGASEGIYGFTNYGVLNSGAVISLEGVLSEFYSYGTIAPGGSGVVAATALSTGVTLDLDNQNTYSADFDPSRIVASSVVAADMLTLSVGSSGQPGLLSAGGTVSPNVVLSNPGKAIRSGSAYILESATAFDASTFTIANTPTVQYALAASSSVQPDLTTLVLSYGIDTTPWSGSRAEDVPLNIRDRVTPNHDRFGRYVDGLLFEDTAPQAADLVRVLGTSVLNVRDFDELLDVYDGYIADEALAMPNASYLSALAFSDQLYGCGRRDGNGMVRSGEEGNCGWVTGYGRVLDTDQHAGPSYVENVLGLAAGARFELSPGTFLGVSTALEGGSIDLDGGDADVTRFLGGVSLGRDLGLFALAGSLQAGYFTSDVSRRFSNGVEALTAESDPDGYLLAAHLRANRRFDFGSAFVEPTLDLGVTWLHQQAYAETGAGGFGASVSALDQTTFSFNPFVTFGSELNFGAMAGQLEFRAGLLALSGSDPSVDASFVGAGPSGPTFRIEGSQSDLFADIGAGIKLQISETMQLRGDFNALISEDQTALGGRLGLSSSF